MRELRVVLVSPSDVKEERDYAERVIEEINEVLAPTLELSLKIFRWESDTTPAFHARGPQGVIDFMADITNCDIVLAIFWKRLGTPLDSGLTGTEHEFWKAYKSWQEHRRPQIMTYFNRAPLQYLSIEEADQIKALLEFRTRFPKEGFWTEYEGPAQFPHILRANLGKMLRFLKEEHPSPAAPPEPVPPSGVTIRDLSATEVSLLEVENAARAPRLQSSFWTDGNKDEFRRLKLPTTPGFVGSRPVQNSIYIVRDPIRPFEIQIGELRSSRPGGDPGLITLTGGMNPDSFRNMYPFIVDEQHKWLRMVLAELETDGAILEQIWKSDPDDEVRRVVARNPSAPNEVKEDGCLFCQPDFMNLRVQAVSGNAKVMHNDYPYGPFFHYIVLPRDAIHSWENVEERHLRDINLAIRELLDPETTAGRGRLGGSAGIRMGLNSSIRHLILGKTTRSSAGASVAHVHKQVWGMAPGSLNLADHLAFVCEAYSRRGIDYLGRYLDTLKRGGLLLWEDAHVALYVPLGQTSIHELQIMVKRPDTNHYLELTYPEIRSLSRAEFIATCLYRAMGINSFNEIVLSRSFDHSGPVRFRVIVTFITREIDLAVSELSLLYVVDRDFGDTVVAAHKHLQTIERALE